MFVTRVTRLVSPVEQELPTLPEHLSPSLYFFVFCGVSVARSLVFCVVFCQSLLVHLSCFSLPLHCLSLIYLRLVNAFWCLQTFIQR